MSKIARNMVLLIVASAVVFIVAAGIYFRSLEVFPFAAGVLLTTAANVVKIILLERTVKKALDMEPGRGTSYIKVQFLFRLALTGAALGLAFWAPQTIINHWGAVAGVFTLKTAGHAMKIIFSPQELEDQNTA